MKAIEILFNKIDELNTQLKAAESICEKANKVYDIRMVADLIYKMAGYAHWSTQDEDYI